MHNSLRGLFLFGALYCATQGALDSWDEAYELPYLSYNCVTVANIALAQTLGVVPMIVKGALCVPSDVLRIRRPFVAAGLLLSGIVFFVQSSFNPLSGFAFYILCLILRNTGAAISDGASDGLTIDAGIDELSGTLSAWQGVGRMAGLIVSTAVGAQIAQRTFAGLLMFLGAWMLASAPVAALVKEELEPSPLGRRAIAWCAWVGNGLTGGRCSRASASAAGEERLEKAAAGAEGAAPPSPLPPLQPVAAEAEAAEGAFVTNPLRASASPALLPLLPPPHPPSAAAADPALEAAPPGPAAQPLPSGAPPEQLSVYMAGATLLRHLRRTPVAAFVAFMFLGQFATYIASFPVVLWLQEQKGFTLEEVGTLTVVGAFGNMLGCYVGGVGFDTVPSKRLALAAATVLSTFPYLLFLAAPAGVATIVPLGNATDAACLGAEAAGSDSATISYALTLGEKAAIIFIWVLCSIGYGALYTVQTGQMRLLADNSVAAMYSGLCMGMLAVAAAAGTYVGGALADGGAGGYDYEACYRGGVYASLGALVVIPWITAADPEVEALRAAQREEAAALGGGKLRRRKSFMDWVGALRGQEVVEAIAAGDRAAEAAAGGGGDEWGAQRATPAPRPLLRRPALGSMGNLLSAQDGEVEGSLWNRLKSRVRGLFEPPEQTRVRTRRRIQAQEWGSTGEGDESPASPNGLF